MQNDESKVVDIEQVCKINDAQLFYREALHKTVEESAARYIAMLHILSHQKYKLASSLLEQSEDINLTAALFLRCRELEAKSRCLFKSYADDDFNGINVHLRDLYALFSPLSGGFSLGSEPLRDQHIGAGSLIHFPTIAGTAVVYSDSDLGDITESVIDLLVGGNSKCVRWLPSDFTNLGIRISVATTQPVSAGTEFHFSEQGTLPGDDALAAVRSCLDMLPLIDVSLSTAMEGVMKVFTVVPRYSLSMRRAGSVSLLPGWAWQDYDSKADPVQEKCHLCVQMVHEFFHTKVNLIERNISLYITDGNTPEVFSPWKQRKRPLRQVVHALLTFSAGASVWAKLVSSPLSLSEDVHLQAERYWNETLSFANLAYQGLIETEALTNAGLRLVSTCIDHLQSSCYRF